MSSSKKFPAADLFVARHFFLAAMLSRTGRSGRYRWFGCCCTWCWWRRWCCGWWQRLNNKPNNKSLIQFIRAFNGPNGRTKHFEIFTYFQIVAIDWRNNLEFKTLLWILNQLGQLMLRIPFNIDARQFHNEITFLQSPQLRKPKADFSYVVVSKLPHNKWKTNKRKQSSVFRRGIFKRKKKHLSNACIIEL